MIADCVVVSPSLPSAVAGSVPLPDAPPDPEASPDDPEDSSDPDPDPDPDAEPETAGKTYCFV